MKYIAYEGTYNEQVYDTKTRVIVRTDKSIKCYRDFTPDLKIREFSGKRIWVKITRAYCKIQELNALIGLNESMMADCQDSKRFYKYLEDQNASFKAKIKNLK